MQKPARSKGVVSAEARLSKGLTFKLVRQALTDVRASAFEQAYASVFFQLQIQPRLGLLPLAKDRDLGHA